MSLFSLRKKIQERGNDYNDSDTLEESKRNNDCQAELVWILTELDEFEKEIESRLSKLEKTYDKNSRSQLHISYGGKIQELRGVLGK